MLAYIQECKNPQSSIWSACWIQPSFYYATILFYSSSQGSVTPGSYNTQVFWVDHSWPFKKWWSPRQVGINEWKEQYCPRLMGRNKIQWFPKRYRGLGKQGALTSNVLTTRSALVPILSSLGNSLESVRLKEYWQKSTHIWGYALTCHYPIGRWLISIMTGRHRIMKACQSVSQSRHGKADTGTYRNLDQRQNRWDWWENMWGFKTQHSSSEADSTLLCSFCVHSVSI